MRVEVCGLRVQGLWFMVWGSGFLGFMVNGLRIRVEDLELRGEG